MLTPLLLAASAAVAAGDETPPNFADHVSPVLRENCVSCHRGSRARNGLDLRSVKAILKGGSAGPAVVPGDSSGSLLYQVIAHTAEPFMPPDEDALDPSIAKLVADWIDGGARVDAKDTGVRAEAAPAEVIAPPLPSGVAPMPEGVPTQPAWWTPRGGVVTAVAVSPGAPLAAVAGYRQVSLYGLPEGELLGVQVDGDHPLGTGEHCALDDVAPDPAGPDHRHRRPGPHPGRVEHRTDTGDHGAAEQGGLVGVDVGCHPHGGTAMHQHRLGGFAEAGHRGDGGAVGVAGQRRIAVGPAPDRVPLQAQPTAAATTFPASAAEGVEAGDDAIAGRELVDIGPDGLDHPAGFVAEHGRHRTGKVTEHHVEVAVAQATRLRADHDLV